MKVFYFYGSSIREKLYYIRLKILRFAVVAKKKHQKLFSSLLFGTVSPAHRYAIFLCSWDDSLVGQLTNVSRHHLELFSTFSTLVESWRVGKFRFIYIYTNNDFEHLADELKLAHFFNKIKNNRTFWSPKARCFKKNKFTFTTKNLSLSIRFQTLSQVIAVISIGFVIVSTLALILSTIPAFQVRIKISISQQPRYWRKCIRRSVR